MAGIPGRPKPQSAVEQIDRGTMTPVRNERRWGRVRAHDGAEAAWASMAARSRPRRGSTRFPSFAAELSRCVAAQLKGRKPGSVVPIKLHLTLFSQIGYIREAVRERVVAPLRAEPFQEILRGGIFWRDRLISLLVLVA